MGYLTLGAGGRITKDDQSTFAQGLVMPRNYQDGLYYNEIFPGSVELGKKRGKGGLKKVVKKVVKLHKRTNPTLIVLRKLKQVVAKKPRGSGSDSKGDEMGPDQEYSESAAPEMTETEGRPQQIVPESAPPPAPSVEQRAEEYPNDSPPVREEEGQGPPPVPGSESGSGDPVTAPPSWAQDGAPSESDGQTSTVEASTPPESSIEDGAVGGWLTTEASPTEHAWENRAPRSRLLPPRGRGGEVSVYTPPRSSPTPAMWPRSLSPRRDKMGRSGLGALAGPSSDGANVLLTAARGEVSQSWGALDQARIAWNKRRGKNYGLDQALRAALITMDVAKTDADRVLISRGIDAGKKLNGWLSARLSFMGSFGNALESESPALVTELGAWVDAFVPARNQISEGFMKSPVWEGVKAGASEFGTRLDSLAQGVARVARKAGAGIERAAEGNVPWWVWLGGAAIAFNALRK